MIDITIPINQTCDSGCGQLAKHLSHTTGRYRCSKSSNSCPANREKNKSGVKKAREDGRIPQFTFTDEHRTKSRLRHLRNLLEEKPFNQLGHTLRKKIVMEDQEYRCLNCNLDNWLGLRITLELDHIDGDRNNNLRENLRCLCPNCHSITDTWKVGNKKEKRIRKFSDEEIIAAFHKNSSMNAILKELKYNWGSAHTVKKVLFRYGLIDSI